MNFDKLLIKFNDQNGCTKKELMEFLNIPVKNKLFFTCKKWDDIQDDCSKMIKQRFSKNYIQASYEPFGKNKYVNITQILNDL